MSVSTLNNFIAAVNATTGKSGATFNVSSQYNDGDLTIYRILNNVTTPIAHVFYSTNPDWGVATDVNPQGAGIILKTFINAPGTGSGTGVSDSVRYMDAQQFINMLAAL